MIMQRYSGGCNLERLVAVIVEADNDNEAKEATLGTSALYVVDSIQNPPINVLYKAADESPNMNEQVQNQTMTIQ